MDNQQGAGLGDYGLSKKADKSKRTAKLVRDIEMILDTLQVLNLFLCLQKHLDIRTVPTNLPLDVNPLILLNNNKLYVNP